MTTPPTPAQRSAQVAAVFDRAAATYEAVGVPWFDPIAEQLVAELAPRPGERVLDVGCGRGGALWPLAQAVGPAGAVTGLDLAPGMIEATHADVQARGLVDVVQLHVMDAAAPDLPAGSFDLIASSLVLFFLPEPLSALRAWRDLLAPGGRLGVSTFAERDPLWVALDDLFTPHLPPQLLDARASGSRGPFASDEGVAALFAEAGLTGVRTTSSEVTARFDNVEHWVAWSWSHGQRVMWECVPEPERAPLQAAAARMLGSAPTREDGKLALTQRVRFTTAVRSQ